MKAKLFYLIAIMLLFIPSSFAQDHGMEERTLKVTNGGNLNISLSVGDVYLTTWEKGEIRIKYDKDEDPGLEISQTGNNIDINSSDDSWGSEISVSLPSQFNIRVKTLGGDIKISGPVKGEIDLATSGGDINMDKAIGNTSLKTSGGDLSTGDIDGDAVITTSGGDIALGEITGKADVKTAGGNIAMNRVGKSADVKTAGGNISVGDIGGDSNIKTGGGNIAAKKINGQAIIKTGGGNISLDRAAGSIDAETGGGNISIHDIVNKFKATTGAGDIYVKLSSNIQGEGELKSGTGSITLNVPADAKVTIKAVVKSFGWGNDESNIVSDFPASKIGGNRNQQTYEINGGGSVIKVYASMGNIRIKKVK